MFTQAQIEDYDYENIIGNKEHDMNVYGRYTEIEKLDFYEIYDDFKNSSISVNDKSKNID